MRIVSNNHNQQLEQKERYEEILWETDETEQTLGEAGGSGFTWNRMVSPWGYVQEENEEKRLRTFFDFVKHGYQLLEEIEKPEKVFRRYFDKKWNQSIEVASMKLAAHMTALARWNTGERWTPPDSVEERKEAWVRLLRQWREEDSFPTLYKRVKDSIQCDKRDLVIYVLMISEISVEDGEQFLDEMSLKKDSESTRRLYPLHFKEGFFRWVMLWNENHSEQSGQKISYEEACDLYESYARELVRTMAVKTIQLEALIAQVFQIQETIVNKTGYQANRVSERKAQEICQTFQEFQMNYRMLWKFLLEHPNEEGRKKEQERVKQGTFSFDCEAILSREESEWIKQIDVFCSTQAEDLQRLCAVIAHTEKSMEQLEQNPLSEQLEGMTEQSELGKIVERNMQTRGEEVRGTQFAIRQMEYLASEEQTDFYEVFTAFKETSKNLIWESYWWMFSELMRLYSQSGRVGGQGVHEGLLDSKNWVEEDNEYRSAREIASQRRGEGYRRYKDARIFGEKREGRLSFSYGGNDISRAIESETANGVLISRLFCPAPRGQELFESESVRKSSSAFSLLKNNYQDWCRGRSGPYQYYKRDNILKMALASGVERVEELEQVMRLAGCQGFNAMDKREAVVYLSALYREKLGYMIQNLWDVLQDGQEKEEWTRQEAEIWREQARQVCAQVPSEWFVRCEIEKELWSRPIERERAAWKNQIQEELEELEELVLVMEENQHSLIYQIRQTEELLLQFSGWKLEKRWREEKKEEWYMVDSELEEMKQILFYGPYTIDFENEKNDKSEKYDKREKNEQNEKGKRRGKGNFKELEYQWIRMKVSLEILLQNLCRQLGEEPEYIYGRRKQEESTPMLFLRTEETDLEKFIESVINQTTQEWQKGRELRGELRGEQTEISESLDSGLLEKAKELVLDALQQANFLMQTRNAVETQDLLQTCFFALSGMVLLERNIQRNVQTKVQRSIQRNAQREVQTESYTETYTEIQMEEMTAQDSSDLLLREGIKRLYHWYAAGYSRLPDCQQYYRNYGFGHSLEEDAKKTFDWDKRFSMWNDIYIDIQMARSSLKWCMKQMPEKRQMYEEMQLELEQKIQEGSMLQTEWKKTRKAAESLFFRRFPSFGYSKMRTEGVHETECLRMGRQYDTVYGSHVAE